MFIGDVRGPVKIPDKVSEAPKETGLKVEKGDDSPNFEKMISESNFERQAEIEKEKSEAGGDFKLGETKNDREFREQLEKVTGKKQDKAKNKLERDDYLNLLVTQLKYQDPSKPMEHFEMASQMAQFNTVEQLMGVNKVLTEMKKLQNDSKAEKLSQYLGKDIEIQGDKIKLSEDGKISLAKFELPAVAGNVVVEIRDEHSKVVKSLPMGSQQAGNHKVIWNGLSDKGALMPAGNYTFSILASTEEGKPMTAKLSFVAKVEGITDILVGGKLDTNLGGADPTKIIAIRNPEELIKSAKPLNPYIPKLNNLQPQQKNEDISKQPLQNTINDPFANSNLESPLMTPPLVNNGQVPQNIIETQRMIPAQVAGQPQRIMPQSPKAVDMTGVKEALKAPNPLAKPQQASRSQDLPPQISPQKYGGPPPVSGINGRVY